MRRNALGLIMVSVLLVGCGRAAESVNEGKLLHERIIDSHATIDAFYRSPILHGGGTGRPLAIVCVPVEDWDSLSAAERKALEAYAESCVERVKASPFTYSTVSSSAPAAALISANVAGMSSGGWGIMVGRISSDGRDIMSDRIAAQGR